MGLDDCAGMSAEPLFPTAEAPASVSPNLEAVASAPASPAAHVEVSPSSQTIASAPASPVDPVEATIAATVTAPVQPPEASLIPSVVAQPVVSEILAKGPQTFDMSADDDQASPIGEPQSASGVGCDNLGASGSAQVTPTIAGLKVLPPETPVQGDSSPHSPVRGEQSADSLAADVRDKYRWLCPEDQKTVCRRECQMAQKREEALVKEILKTIDRYTHALEVARVVGSFSGSPQAVGSMAAFGDLTADVSAGARGAPGLTPELAARYEERIRFLRGTLAALQTEPTVTLPALTPLEQTKGAVFAGYAQTARVVDKFKEKARLSLQQQSEEGGGAAPVIANTRQAFGSFVSGFRRKWSEGTAALQQSGYPTAQTVTPPAADSGYPVAASPQQPHEGVAQAESATAPLQPYGGGY